MPRLDLFVPAAASRLLDLRASVDFTRRVVSRLADRWRPFSRFYGCSESRPFAYRLSDEDAVEFRLSFDVPDGVDEATLLRLAWELEDEGVAPMHRTLPILLGCRDDDEEGEDDL